MPRSSLRALCALALVLLAGRTAGADPPAAQEWVLPPAAADVLRAMAAPSHLHGEVAPGWVWTSLTVTPFSAVFGLAGPDGSAELTILHPSVAAADARGRDLALVESASTPDGRAALQVLATRLLAADRRGAAATLWRRTLTADERLAGASVAGAPVATDDRERAQVAGAAFRWIPVGTAAAAAALLLLAVTAAWKRLSEPRASRTSGSAERTRQSPDRRSTRTSTR